MPEGPGLKSQGVRFSQTPWIKLFAICHSLQGSLEEVANSLHMKTLVAYGPCDCVLLSIVKLQGPAWLGPSMEAHSVLLETLGPLILLVLPTRRMLLKSSAPSFSPPPLSALVPGLRTQALLSCIYTGSWLARRGMPLPVPSLLERWPHRHLLPGLQAQLPTCTSTLKA